MQLEALLAKLDEQLALLRQATPLLRARAQALPDATAAAVRRQLAAVLDQQTDAFEASMQVRAGVPTSFNKNCKTKEDASCWQQDELLHTGASTSSA